MNLHASHVAAAAFEEPSSLESCDEQADAAVSARYCPAELLGSFALLMAGHGRCVSTAMMLGDRDYAMWQIGCARSMGDTELAAMASRLFAYYA